MLNGVLKHFSHLLHAGTLPLVHISYDGSACGLLDLSSWSSFPTVYTIVVASTLVASQTFSLFLSFFPHSSHVWTICFWSPPSLMDFPHMAFYTVRTLQYPLSQLTLDSLGSVMWAHYM